MKKRADGRYETKVTINGKRHAFYGKTQAEVYRKIAEFKEVEETGVLFRQVAGEWEEEHLPELAFNTQKGYRAPLARAIEVFGDEPIKDLSAQQIDEYLRSFAVCKARKTVANQLLVIREILQFACLRHGLKYNPAQFVSIPRNLPKTGRKFPEADDIQLVKDNVNEPFGLFMAAALFSGLRRGELCALQWKDIDFERKRISVTKAAFWTNDGKPHIKSTKTAAGNREVILTQYLYDLLLPLKSRPNEYVFGKKDMLTGSQMILGLRYWQRATGSDLTPHSLRHGFASILWAAGVDAKTCQDQLGHSSIQISLDIYTHLDKNKKEREAEKLENYLSRI